MYFKINSDFLIRTILFYYIGTSFPGVHSQEGVSKNLTASVGLSQNGLNQNELEQTGLERNGLDENYLEPMSTLKPNGLEQSGLLDVISALPKSMRELFARSYISARLRRYSMYPGEKTMNHRSKITRKPLLGQVPIIPEGVPTPKWIPGELIASQVTKRQLKLIDESVFGPLRSATMFPSVMSTILVFNQRYDPVRLAEVLKAHFGIEAEPNGMISEA